MNIPISIKNIDFIVKNILQINFPVQITSQVNFNKHLRGKWYQFCILFPMDWMFVSSQNSHVGASTPMWLYLHLGPLCRQLRVNGVPSLSPLCETPVKVSQYTNQKDRVLTKSWIGWDLDLGLLASNESLLRPF